MSVKHYSVGNGYSVYVAGDRLNPQDKTPLGHNPFLCCHMWVGYSQNPSSWVG